MDPAIRVKHYREYREYTRRDFRNVCAYCFAHEDEAGGPEHFEQDHFEPKRNVDVDPNNYANLYWSCRGCNGQGSKGSVWPSADQIERGERFSDSCQYDPMGVDYEEEENGELRSLTPAGGFTIRHIRLNRSAVVYLRLRRRAQRERIEAELKLLRNAVQSSAWRDNVELCSLVNAYEASVSREPFMLTNIPPPVPRDVIDYIASRFPGP